MNTAHKQAPYFVNKEFRAHSRNSDSLSKFEQRIEKEYTDFVRDECVKERQAKKESIDKARAYNGPDQQEVLKKAHSIPVPNCVNYERMITD